MANLICFKIKKAKLPWINFNTSEVNIQQKCLQEIRISFFEAYPHPSRPNEAKQRLKIMDNKIEILFYLGCKAQAETVICGRWELDGDDVNFSAIICKTGCDCSIPGMIDFYRTSKFQLTLRNAGATQHRNIVALPSRPSPKIGRAFFPVVSLDLKHGELIEVECVTFQKKVSKPFTLVGAVELETKEAVTISYAAVRGFFAGKQTSVDMDQNELLIAIGHNNHRHPLNGTSLGLAVAVSIASYILQKPAKHMVFTGRVSPSGDIGSIGGIGTKVAASQHNELVMFAPTANIYDVPSNRYLGFVETIEQLFNIVFDLKTEDFISF